MGATDPYTEPPVNSLGGLLWCPPRALSPDLGPGGGVDALEDRGDAQRLLEGLGFQELRVAGSHHVYGRPGMAQQLNLQERQGKAKPYQLRQLASLVRRYNLSLEGS